MRMVETAIPGVLLLEPFRQADRRGSFVKLLRMSELAQTGLGVQWTETYASISRRGVLRGMHLQSRPSEHAKLVCCIAGAALDVVLDVRPTSPTRGHFLSFDLHAGSSPVVHVPHGVAHGFLALEDDTCMHYQVSSEHDPSSDSGYRWDSFGFDWPATEPILSERDLALPRWDSP